MGRTRRTKRKEFEVGLLKENQPYLVVDTETGGLRPGENALIEVSYAIIVNRFIPVRRQLLMHDRKVITEKALEVNGYERNIIRTYGSDVAAAEQFALDLGKVTEMYNPDEVIIPVGHNVRFDLKFIEAWLRDVHMGEYFDFYFGKPLDTLDLAKDARNRGWIKTENAKLETIAEYFGCHREGAHTAKVDVEMTIDVLERLLQLKKRKIEEIE
mgnify:FL=1